MVDSAANGHQPNGKERHGSCAMHVEPHQAWGCVPRPGA
jgi:hypothetical protein